MPMVESSAIRSIDYDPDRRELYVTFTSGESYTYFDVSTETYEDWIAAPPKGEYFRKHILGRYGYARRK